MDETPLQKIIRNRRSIRKFSSDIPVEREKVRACLESARLAPSANNVQPWRFIVLDDPEIRDGAAKAAFSGVFSTCKFAAQAPVLVVLLDRPDFMAGTMGKEIRRVPFDMVDMGITGEHLVLQAEEFGLSTCWVGWFNEKKLRKFLKIPKKYRIVALLPIGYAETRPTRSPSKRDFDDVVWFNTFKGGEDDGPSGTGEGTSGEGRE